MPPLFILFSDFMKRHLRGVLITICTSLLALVFLELAYRGYSLASKKQKLYQRDSLTGWSPRPNVSYSKTLVSSKGRSYEGIYTTDKYGLRFSPKNLSSKDAKANKKLLVIGDSFTGDFYSSDSEAWFAYLAKELPLDVYAYGMGGSGTFQQHLAFQKLFPIVKPDILLIQVCSNDPQNDSYLHSYNSIVKNQDLRRPYYYQGQKIYRNGALEASYRALYDYSDLFKRFDLIHQLNQFSRTQSYSIRPISKEELNEQISNWKQIYRRYIASARALGVKDIWSVNCASGDDGSLFHSAWLDESSDLGVKTFTSFASSIADARESGKDVFFADGGHLSDIGNQIAGLALAQEIIQYQGHKTD